MKEATVLNKASIKARCQKAYKFFVRQYGEDRECAVYNPRRYKIVGWRAFVRWGVVSGCFIASQWVSDSWSPVVMLPVVWIAFLGSVSVVQQGMAFKMGWFAGNTDLAITIKKNDPNIGEAVEEQTLRMNFVLEGLGVGRREDLWDDEDES
jgi:hypothetical protein